VREEGVHYEIVQFQKAAQVFAENPRGPSDDAAPHRHGRVFREPATSPVIRQALLADFPQHIVAPSRSAR
jgi:hypothetical protein